MEKILIHGRDENKEQLCSCGEKAKYRYDNGLPAGWHCDDCWEKMVSEARSRSW